MAMKVGTRPIGSTTTTSVTRAEMRNSTGIEFGLAAAGLPRSNDGHDRTSGALSHAAIFRGRKIIFSQAIE